MTTFEAGPGLLLVFAELGDQVTEHDFHDWYDNEHIPLRTSSLPTFTTAARFKALDNLEPKWGAMYAISDNTIFGQEEYTKLRANRSPREAALVGRLGVLDRRVYKQTVSSSMLTPTSPAPKIVIFQTLTPSNASEETSALLSSSESRFAALPGFLRSSRYDNVDTVRSGLKVKAEGSEKTDVGSIIQVIEFSNPSILEEESYTSLMKWYDDTLGTLTSHKLTRTFELWKEYEPTAALRHTEK